MKINIEVDLEPEELRRLLGLPDAQPFWDSINERIADGDSEIASELLKNFLSQSLKGTETVSKLVRGFGLFRSEPTEEKKPPTRKKTTGRKKTTRRKSSK